MIQHTWNGRFSMVWVLHCNVHTIRVPLFNFVQSCWLIADCNDSVVVQNYYVLLKDSCCQIKQVIKVHLIYFVAAGKILYFVATKVLHVVNNSICWWITPGHRTFIMPIFVMFISQDNCFVKKLFYAQTIKVQILIKVVKDFFLYKATTKSLIIRCYMYICCMCRFILMIEFVCLFSSI